VPESSTSPTTPADGGAPAQARIVVGVDASEESRGALRWALRYAEVVGARLDVVHAWHVADEHAWLQSLPPPANPTDVARKALAAMVDDVMGTRRSVPVETAVREGHAARVLVEESRGAALLVVGSRGFGGFDGLLLGSVSAHCAAHAPCSVMIVRDGDALLTMHTP
jgi:nucleotide-binding universal stress UspA family protein